MSTFYKKSREVPTAVIANRLMELAKAASDGIRNTSHEFTMRIPAELDRDADLVMAEAANRLVAMQAEIAAIRALEPAAWVNFSDSGNIRIWSSASDDALRLASEYGFALKALYALPEQK